MKELISIVIPVYNALPYLEECLASATSQSYSNLEIIVINDGSTDASEGVARKFAEADKRIKLHSQENQGLGYTRNRGIALSRGNYIFFLDADDAIPKNAISSLATAIARNDVDYAVGKVVRFNESRMYVPIRHLEFNLYQQAGLATLEEKPELLQDSIACNKLWKKSLLVDHGLAFKEGKYYEDLALTMKGAVLAKKIQVVNDVVYHWRVRDDEDKPSITQQQMKLENTSHRLEALAENRQWLQESRIAKEIIEEHDLKSLLDVLRLHVIKYALIDEEDKKQWEQQILSFLRSIPPEIAQKLPGKEQTMYNLLMEGNMEDLYLFTEMLMYAEKTATVAQEEHRFLLQGRTRKYDVTPYFKPVMVVEGIGRQGTQWRLEGQLTVPKASFLPEGNFYTVNRTTGQEKVLAPLQIKQAKANACYPFEELTFAALLDSVPLLATKEEGVYDFYYRLEAYPQTTPARIRVLPGAMQTKQDAKAGSFNLSLYRTNYGNLSMKLHKKQLKDLVAAKLRPFLNR